jgi:hypothetical protein
MRGDPRILLEEIDGDEVVVRVQATPDHPPDGAQLASEVLAAVSSVTRRMESAEEVARRSPASSTRPDATVDYDPAGVE